MRSQEPMSGQGTLVWGSYRTGVEVWMVADRTRCVIDDGEIKRLVMVDGEAES